MRKKNLPVHSIGEFHQPGDDAGFYINAFVPHLEEHHFVRRPHKHDFFLVVLFTRGSGMHEIDFQKYPIRPGSMFLLSPGQMHHWKLSGDIDGYIFFHTKDFFDLAFTHSKVQEYPFFSSGYNAPYLLLKSGQATHFTDIFRDMLQEYDNDRPLKFQKIRALLHNLYIDASRLYITKKAPAAKSSRYLESYRKLEELLEIHYKKEKSPAWYAPRLHMSEKHLNRICRDCVGKTTTDIISDRVMLEAKRLLVHGEQTVSEISWELGYDDHSYFSRLFKKRCGETPLGFMKKYR